MPNAFPLPLHWPKAESRPDQVNDLSLEKKRNKCPLVSAEVMVCPTVNVGRSVLDTDKKGWSFGKKEKACL